MDWVVKNFEKGKKIPYHKIYEKTGLRNVIGIAINGHYALAGPIYICGVLFNGPIKIKNFDDPKVLGRQGCDTLAQEYRNNEKILWDFAVVPPGHVVYTSLKEAIRFGVITILNRFAYIQQYDLIISEPFEWGDYTPESYRGVKTLVSRQAPEQSDLVSVAGVLARSARERFMASLSKDFPEFGWDTNTGHGTIQHIEAIKTYGVSIEHRGLDRVRSLKGTAFKVYRSGYDRNNLSSN